MNAKIKVLIPVSVGGYTGQRDAWEESERDYQVSADGDKVVLTSQGTAKTTIKFSQPDLREALRVLGLEQPVYRGERDSTFTTPGYSG